MLLVGEGVEVDVVSGATDVSVYTDVDSCTELDKVDIDDDTVDTLLLLLLGCISEVGEGVDETRVVVGGAV